MKCCEDKKISDVWFIQTGWLPYQRIRQQYFGIIEKKSDLDGIFATSDVMAANIIRACKKMGKRVPEDISIVGFDDTWISTLTYPSITTIHQPVQEMCEYAIEAIVKKVKSEKVPSQVVFPVELIDRESTK